MARKYFGTDGIRGKVGDAPITPEFVMRLGYAAGVTLVAREKLPAGDMILYPSTSLHRVEPVAWGERLVALVRLRTTTQAAPDERTVQQELRQLEGLARALPPSQRPARWLACGPDRPQIGLAALRFDRNR